MARVILNQLLRNIVVVVGIRLGERAFKELRPGPPVAAPETQANLSFANPSNVGSQRYAAPKELPADASHIPRAVTQVATFGNYATGSRPFPAHVRSAHSSVYARSICGLCLANKAWEERHPKPKDQVQSIPKDAIISRHDIATSSPMQLAARMFLREVSKFHRALLLSRDPTMHDEVDDAQRVRPRSSSCRRMKERRSSLKTMNMISTGGKGTPPRERTLKARSNQNDQLLSPVLHPRFEGQTKELRVAGVAVPSLELRHLNSALDLARRSLPARTRARSAGSAPIAKLRKRPADTYLSTPSFVVYAEFLYPQSIISSCLSTNRPATVSDKDFLGSKTVFVPSLLNGHGPEPELDGERGAVVESICKSFSSSSVVAPSADELDGATITVTRKEWEIEVWQAKILKDDARRNEETCLPQEDKPFDTDGACPGSRNFGNYPLMSCPPREVRKAKTYIYTRRICKSDVGSGFCMGTGETEGLAAGTSGTGANCDNFMGKASSVPEHEEEEKKECEHEQQQKECCTLEARRPVRTP
ncbi:hypothetical protein BDZ89DRAFT_1046798 [Hymenopellis radicata]|nr:hypothetical protein BDZ89DRAFT_1046798 [Hymenopellis radicata]